MDRVRHTCTSVSCATAEKYDADRLCAGCRSVFYCSHECQRADWKGRKPACKVATAEREASQIVRVGKGGGIAPAAAAPARVGHPASQYVAGAARGKTEALCNLGCCYASGEGVSQRYERAAELWQQAAAQGYADAQYNLGCSHRDGKGMPQSYERAAELYQQAAAQGDTKAQTSLGILYYNGQGVPQDDARAVALLKQAAAGRDKAAPRYSGAPSRTAFCRARTRGGGLAAVLDLQVDAQGLAAAPLLAVPALPAVDAHARPTAWGAVVPLPAVDAD